LNSNAIIVCTGMRAFECAYLEADLTPNFEDIKFLKKFDIEYFKEK